MKTTVLEDPPDILIERCGKPVATFSLLDSMRVERGTVKDWDALHALHYKAESLPVGAHFYRCVTADDELVGVVVMGIVSLLSQPRHDMFPKLKPGGDTYFTNVHRGKWLNANFRRAARIVTDTLYRGVGISYRMVNLACRLEGKRFIEIQSSMSKFNPFDVKAGFRHANLRHATAYKDGVKFFQRYFSAHPADLVALMEEFNSYPPKIQAGVEKAVKEFYYERSAKEKTGSNLRAGSSKVNATPLFQVMRELQQLVFASPVYGVWENPDVGRELPESLPLSAFDLQGPTEPLRLDLL